MRRADIETTVVGGGVIGLAIAAAAAKAGQEVLLLERNAATGQEISSRSSEVIHAGIYYPVKSKKAEFCVSGRQRLYKFAQENGVPFKQLGKLVVATSEAEVPILSAILERAQSNGVDDLCILDVSDLRAIEPEISGMAALLSPSSGIIDSHSLMQALEGHLTESGGTVVLNTSVEGVRVQPNGSFQVSLRNRGEPATFSTRNLHIAAGLGMNALRDLLPRRHDYKPPQLQFAKGHYFGLSQRAPFQHLVYPLPVDGGLGTHLTLDMEGRARFGPDVKWIDKLNYAFDDADGLLTQKFESDIRRYWPSLPDKALQPAYTGIRPKLSREGEAPRDFEIHGPNEHGIARMVVLYGIESPGLTACLAIADFCNLLIREID